MAIEAPDREIIALLLSVGLSEREARVYSAILTREQARAKEIAELTSIPQPHIYSIVKSLHSKAIVEIIIGEPKKYRAIPLEIAIDRLISEKEKELTKLKSRSQEVAQKYM